MKTETTQTAQHTPGTWSIDLAKNNTHLTSVYHGDERPFLERPWNVAICTGPQSESNARLIASAPDLLAFAERVASWHGDEQGMSACVWAELIRQACVVVAEAKGNK